MLSKDQKAFREEIRHDEQKRIMTMEFLIWQSQRNIENKQAYLLVIEQRIKDGFYPSLHAGSEDRKETEAAIKIAQDDIVRFQDQKETAEESLVIYEEYWQHLTAKTKPNGKEDRKAD